MLHFETSYLNTKDSFIHVQRFKNDHIQYMYVHTTDSSLNTNLEIFLPHV